MSVFNINIENSISNNPINVRKILDTSSRQKRTLENFFQLLLHTILEEMYFYACRTTKIAMYCNCKYFLLMLGRPTFCLWTSYIRIFISFLLRVFNTLLSWTFNISSSLYVSWWTRSESNTSQSWYECCGDCNNMKRIFITIQGISYCFWTRRAKKSSLFSSIVTVHWFWK